MKGQTQPTRKSVVSAKLLGAVGSLGPTHYVLAPQVLVARERVSVMLT